MNGYILCHIFMLLGVTRHTVMTIHFTNLVFNLLTLCTNHIADVVISQIYTSGDVLLAEDPDTSAAAW